MQPFVSEESQRMHLEYVNTLRVKLSVLRKMHKDVEGSRRGQVDSQNSKREAYVSNEICLHEAYFNSFSEMEFPRSVSAAQAFGSDNELLSMLYKLAMESPHGFVGVTRDRRGRLQLFSHSSYSEISGGFKPLLAIDVCEHAYFFDFEFDKERYVRRALAYLSLDRLDEFS